MGKEVRSFTLEHEVGQAIDREADLLGPGKRSELVNNLLKEALEQRERTRIQTVRNVTEATILAASTMLFLFVLIAVLP